MRQKCCIWSRATTRGGRAQLAINAALFLRAAERAAVGTALAVPIRATMSARPGERGGRVLREQHGRDRRDASESRAAPPAEARDRAAQDAAAARARRHGGRGRAQRPHRPRAAARVQRGSPGGGPDVQRDLTACAVVALGGYGRRELSPCSGRRSAVPPLGVAGARAHGVRRARADDCSGTGASASATASARRTNAWPRRATTCTRAPRCPTPGWWRATRGCSTRSSGGSRRRCAEPLRARRVPLPDAAGVVRADAAARGGRLRDRAAASRKAWAACATCTPCCWVAHARYGIRGLAGARTPPACSTTRDVKAAARRLRLPAARAQPGALHDRPQGRPADARPARRARGAPRLPGARRPAGRGAADARLLPRAPRSSTRCAARTWSPSSSRSRGGTCSPRCGCPRTPRGHDVARTASSSRAAAPGCAAQPPCSRSSSAPRRACRCRASSRRRCASRPRSRASACGGRARPGETLLRIASQRGRVAATFRALHETGVLQRLIPEWSRITFLVQHDFFHKYTVDEHSLRAVAALDGLLAGRDPEEAALARIFDELRGRARRSTSACCCTTSRRGAAAGTWRRESCSARRILSRLGIAARSRTPSCSWSARTSRCPDLAAARPERAVADPVRSRPASAPSSGSTC